MRYLKLGGVGAFRTGGPRYRLAAQRRRARWKRAFEPDAEEGKSYGMAALRYRGRPLLSVVVARHGYSLFPFSSENVERAVAALPGFDATKGGIRFTDAKPIPDQVFDRIVRDRRDQIDTALTKP